MTLALKYRPKLFSDITGQRPVWLVLRKMVQLDQVPSALLFTGSRGCGKTSTARILAAALNCDGTNGEPCGTCPSCEAVADGTAFSVTEIDAASNGLVADIKKLHHDLMYESGGKYRVVLLDEAHSMSKEAFNALLKLLEEPPPRTIFVLLTTEKGKIPPTVASRCMPFPFRRIAVPEIVGRLSAICTAEWPEAVIDPALLSDIAERADGGMRDAVMLLDQARSVGILTLAQYQSMTGDSDFGPALITAMADGDTAGLFSLLDRLVCDSGDYTLISSRMVRCLTDILVLVSGGTPVAQGASLAARKALAARLSPQHVTASLRVLWELRTKVRVGSDPRSSLELAVVMCLEQLKPKVAVVPAATNGNGHGKMDVAEMQRLAGVA